MPRFALPLVAALAASPLLGQSRPNVVLLVADDLGWMDLTCQGSDFHETPNIDSIAARGVRFTQALSASPICSPTRVALLTGKNPTRLGATSFFHERERERPVRRRSATLVPPESASHLPLDEVTFAETLRDAGYRTGFFGKWHLGGEGFWPRDQGFEVNVAGSHEGHSPGGYFAPYRLPNMPEPERGTHLTTRLTDSALEWMESVREDEFLLVLSYYAVHWPLETTPQLEEKYRGKLATVGAGPPARRDGRRVTATAQRNPVYAGMLQSVDDSVGRVLRKLDELELSERTVVIFTSDNGGFVGRKGPTANHPLREGKGWLYEGGIRVPLLVHWPGRTRAGATSDVPVTTADLYPTLLDVAGLPARPEQHIDGVSLAPLLGAEPAFPERHLFWHLPHYSRTGSAPCGAVRDGDWKLVEWFEDQRVELFDLATDPGEATDRAASEPERAQRMRAALAEWRERVGARMPTPESEDDD